MRYGWCVWKHGRFEPERLDHAVGHFGVPAATGRALDDQPEKEGIRRFEVRVAGARREQRLLCPARSSDSAAPSRPGRGIAAAATSVAAVLQLANCSRASSIRTWSWVSREAVDDASQMFGSAVSSVTRGRGRMAGGQETA